jgi:hypothetical protein
VSTSSLVVTHDPFDDVGGNGGSSSVVDAGARARCERSDGFRPHDALFLDGWRDERWTARARMVRASAR